VSWTSEKKLLESQQCLVNRFTINSLEVLNIITQLHHLRGREKPYIKCGGELLPKSN